MFRKNFIFNFIIYWPPFGVEYSFTNTCPKFWRPESPSSYASFLLAPIPLSDIRSNRHILDRVDQAQLDNTFRINIQNSMVPLRYWILMTQGMIWIDLLWYQMVSEKTSPSTVWFGDEPNGSWWACITKGWREQGSGRQCIRHDIERLPTIYRRTESHRNERDPGAMQVWDCMVEGRFNENESVIYD